MNNLQISHAKLALQLGRPARVWPDTPFYDRLCTDKSWVAEPKKNGWRCLACAGLSPAKPALWSRHGRQIEKPYAELRDTLAKLPRAQLDGELMLKSGELWVFDALSIEGESLLLLPYTERRALLQAYVQGTNLRLMPSWEDRSKREGYDVAVKDGDEGIVFKRRDSSYPSGKTHDWIKCRFSLLGEGV